MKAKSLDKAFEELQNIVSQLQSDEMGIDNLSNQLKKASELVTFCKEKLRSVEEDIQKISPDQDDSE